MNIRRSGDNLQVTPIIPTSSVEAMQEPQLEVRPIRDITELWQVYALTHDCYVETGYIQPRPTGLLVHYAEFDHIPETTILVAVDGDEIVGSLSYTIDGPSGFIIEKDYPEECAQIRQEPGRRLADYWRFVIKKSYRDQRGVMMALMLQSGAALIQQGVNTFFLDVHEKHMGAYLRMFNGSVVARRKGVPGLEYQHIEAVLIRWDIENMPTRWWGRLPQAVRSAGSPTSSIPAVNKEIPRAKNLAEKYEHDIQNARQALNNSRVIQTLASPSLSDKLFLIFLLKYCIQNISITQFLEGWLQQSVKTSEAAGLNEQAINFKMQAQKESFQKRMLQADAKALERCLAERFNLHFDVDALIKLAVAQNKRSAYEMIHREIAAPNQLYRQFAIKYEIDRLTLEYGAWVVRTCLNRFGMPFLSNLSFLHKGVMRDVEMTQFNWLELGRLVSQNSDLIPPLVGTGVRALFAFQTVLDNCLEITELNEVP